MAINSEKLRRNGNKLRRNPYFLRGNADKLGRNAHFLRRNSGKSEKNKKTASKSDTVFQTTANITTKNT